MVRLRFTVRVRVRVWGLGDFHRLYMYIHDLPHVPPLFYSILSVALLTGCTLWKCISYLTRSSSTKYMISYIN